MKCPYCKEPDSRVIDSRISGEGYTIRRRRECPKCEARFTTYEQIAETKITVIKKNGERVLFDREKIRRGVARACEKRSVSQEDIDTLIAEVEAEVLGRGEAEIASSAVGDLVIERLRKLDDVAYVRFASVYRAFKHVSDFDAEIRPMLSERSRPGH